MPTLSGAYTIGFITPVYALMNAFPASRAIELIH